MTRSYIQPKSKQILSDEMQLVILFFTISIAMLFLTYGFLRLKIYTFEQSITRIETKKVELKNSTQKMQHQIQIVEQESDRAEKVVTENSVLKESVKNLFDLVPDRIILTEVELNKNSLIMKGITPSKDVYDFLLQAPLRSIFNNTYTSFYQADNGWLSFVSTNTLDDEELLQ
jgi:Tfp pilus assembly protein PilN